VVPEASKKIESGATPDNLLGTLDRLIAFVAPVVVHSATTGEATFTVTL